MAVMLVAVLSSMERSTENQIRKSNNGNRREQEVRKKDEEDSGPTWWFDPPTEPPTTKPTSFPTAMPTTTTPTAKPSARPTMVPFWELPTALPTPRPTRFSGPLPIPPSFQWGRLTPEPTAAPTVVPPSAAPTDEPTYKPTDAPTIGPTDAPSVAPTDAPTERPSASPTEKPTKERTTESPTESPTASPTVRPWYVTVPYNPNRDEESTDAPTVAPSFEPVDEDTDELTNEPTNEPTNAPTALFLEADEKFVLEVQTLVDTSEFVVDFSLWSPEGTAVKSVDSADHDELAEIQDGVLTSLRSLHCKDSLTSVCTVRNEWLILSPINLASSQTKDMHHNDLTLVVPKISGLNLDGFEGNIWTTWDISYQIMQLGAPFIHEILEMVDEPEATPLEVNQLARDVLQERLVADITSSLRNGTFDMALRNEFKGQGWSLYSSPPGEEGNHFPFDAVSANPAANGNEDHGGDEKFGIYIAVCAVLACIAGVLFYFYLRKRNQGMEPQPHQNDVMSALDTDNESGPVKAVTSTTQPNGVKKMEEYNNKMGYGTPAPPPLFPDILKDASTHSEAPNDDTKIASGSSASEEDDVSELQSHSELQSQSQATSTGYETLASWKRRPARFVLSADAPIMSQEESNPDDGTFFPTGGGSIVAGSNPGGSVGNASVDSSLDAWSVNSGVEMKWA